MQSEDLVVWKNDWQQMQLLLDKHLPQRRRDIFYFLLLAVLNLGAFSFIYINNS
jgi:hypothetical protein